MELREVTQVPLSDLRGGVSSLLEDFRPGYIIWIDADRFLRTNVFSDAGLDAVQARQHRHARRGTHRRRYERIDEICALPMQPVHVRRVNIFITIDPDCPSRLIVRA